MKSKILFGILLLATPWLTSCGKEPRFLNQTRTGSCPLMFSSENLCADIRWVQGPSADVLGMFEITFWNKDSGNSSGPFIDPQGQVGAFLRMACCGSVSFPKVAKAATGKFLVSEAKFVPGSWEVYVQLKRGELVDKQFVKVQIDD